jgi:diguanylate cyclase (GGDEF)-like protein/PAS domain S-box-containing protein
MFSPNKKIVVVDDSILNLRIIEKYLGNNYIEIIKCSDSQKALDIIKQELPDLVLLDIHMPNLTGIDLLKQMRQDTLLSIIPVIFVTASEEKVHLQLAYNLGTVDYIHKPIVKEELIAKVQNYLFYIEEKNILQRYYNIIDEFVLTLITDTEDIVLYVSAAFTKRTDFDKVDILGCSFTELLIQNSEEKLWEDIKFTLTEQSIWKGKIRIKTKNHFFWADTVIQKIYDNKNNLIGYQYIMNDITDKLILQEIAIRDPLTNLYNRLKILELIQYEIEKAQRYNHVFSLLMIDIDDFKHINDTFGHNFGDEVLKEFSKCLKQSVRKIDIVSRWGGEEFLILLPETTKEQALKVANRIKENLSKVYVDYNNIVVSMNTASFGLTEYHREDNSNLLIEKVDKALYISKNNGKNKISLYS